MNNEQFRRLVSANTPKPSSQSNGASPTPPRGATLGSKQRANIPMTPRSVAGAHRSDFARQLAEKNQADKPKKQFRSFAPKGSKLAEGYIDRAQARHVEEEDDRAARIASLEEALKKEEIDQETFDKLRSQIAGGDLASTHLVKGLDFKLLERVRKGEDVYNDSQSREQEADPEADAEPEDLDDAFDRLEDEEIATMTKEKSNKKGQLSTAALNPSKKRTRDQILAEMKAARDAAKTKEESALGSRFKKIGPKTPGTRFERDSKGREVMIIVDEDGVEKRKVRKVQADPEDGEPKKDLMLPDPNAKPLGMEVPEIYKARMEEPEDEDGDVNIFDDAGDDYDPLAGLGEEDSDEDEDTDKPDETKRSDATTKDKDAMPPPPRPSGTSEARNYFKDSKTALVSSESVKAPSMSDPAIQAAFKKAASLSAHARASEDDEDDEEAKAKAERRRKMLQNVDRDAEDMDMGFGTSRFEDEADFDDQRVKLSEWGDDGEDGNQGKGGGSKRKRGPKKRKGDANNASDDVFAILLGVYHPGIRLLGLSTVHGNASLDKTTANALSVLEALGQADAYAVYPGAAQALARAPIHAPADIHGESGLDGTALLPSVSVAATRARRDVPAVDAMAAALRAQAPGTAWVVATGAATNVAALFRAHPDLKAHVAGVSLMGGAVGGGFTPAPMGKMDGDAGDRVGNITPWAEFNVLIDPEAAAAILEDEVLAKKATIAPLDLTHLVLATRDVQDLLLRGPAPATDVSGLEKGAVMGTEPVGVKEGEPKSKLRVMLIELLNFFADTYRDKFGIVEGPPLHDPLAVAAILTGTPHEIAFYDFDPAEGAERQRERFAVTVVRDGTLEEALEKGTAQTGRTLVRRLPPGEEGVRIPRGLDIRRFWTVIEECCQRADEVNKKNGSPLA
ncbi:inosine-uridine preferring nucleoside hydrolase-domain-containing protein [Xylariomycetidae sp. FL0641]|nr:inosine-uridine preferring nucleoside hydrolase-domain-containing protein [Xylariomycetidae sp. FL0641]